MGEGELTVALCLFSGHVTEARAVHRTASRGFASYADSARRRGPKREHPILQTPEQCKLNCRPANDNAALRET